MNTLLQKALEAKVPRRQKKGATAEELELAVAYFHGRVSAHQLMAAIGEKAENAAGSAKGWAVRVLEAGLRAGQVTITVEDPEEDEADARREAAKAAPVAVKAVAR